MAKKLYVGNLPWSVTNLDFEDIVIGQGLTPAKCEVVYDRETVRSRGFGFLHFETDEQGREAIAALNGLEVKGRPLVVNEATSRQQDRDKSRPRGGRDDHRRGGDNERGRGRKPRGFRDEDQGGW